MKKGQPDEFAIETNVRTFYDEMCPPDQETCFKSGCTDSSGSGLSIDCDMNLLKTVEVISSLREMTSNYTGQPLDISGTPKSIQVSLECMVSNMKEQPPGQMETSVQLINSELVNNRVNSSQYSTRQLTAAETPKIPSVKKNQSYVVTTAPKPYTETEFQMKKHLQNEMENCNKNSCISDNLCDLVKNVKTNQKLKPQQNAVQSPKEQRYSEEKAQADFKKTMCRCASLTQVTLWKLKESSQKLHSLVKDFEPMNKMKANREIKNGTVNTGTDSPMTDPQEFDSPTNDVGPPKQVSCKKETCTLRHDSDAKDMTRQDKELYSPRQDAATKDVPAQRHDSPRNYVASQRHGTPKNDMYSPRNYSPTNINLTGHNSPTKDTCSPKKDFYSAQHESLPTKELYSARHKIAGNSHINRMKKRNDSTVSRCCFCLHQKSEVYVLDQEGGTGLATGNKNPNDTCTVYKKITRKCQCIVEKASGETYNELVQKFNENNQQSSNPLGEIIRNIKIVKKFITTGTKNAKIALNFLLQGLKESSESEQNEIVEGCVYADICDIFEDCTIISKCILSACFSHDDAVLQELTAEFIFNLGNYEEGKRYLNMNANILNDIQKCLKSSSVNQNEQIREYLVGVISFMESNEDTLAELVEDGILQDIINSLMRSHTSMDLDQLHRNLVLVQKMSSTGKGQEILLKDFKTVSFVIKDLLDHYSDCGVNSCVTSILSNILSSSACERNALCKKCAGLVEQKVAATSCLKIRSCKDKCVDSKRTCSKVKFGETLSACINICLGEEEEELLSELSDQVHYGIADVCTLTSASGMTEDKHLRNCDSENKTKYSKIYGNKVHKSVSDKKSKSSKSGENHSNRRSGAASKIVTESVYCRHIRPCPTHHLDIEKNLDKELHNCVFVINKKPEEVINASQQ